MRRAARAAAVVALLSLGGSVSAQNCPDGTVAVAGGRCVRDMSRGGPFMQMRGKFKGAGCPSGTHTVESAIGFRCVMGSGDGDRAVPGRDTRGRRRLGDGGADPAAAAAPAAQPELQHIPAAAPATPETPRPDAQIDEKVLTSTEGKAAPPAAKAQPAKEFVPYKAKGLALAVPRGWHVTDAWKDEIPTLYVELDERRGKPVTMLVSRLAPGQAGYEPMDSAIAKEKEYQGARETTARKVSGFDARQTVVEGESRTVYADAGDGAYYLFSFTAPKDSYPVYEPAFQRLLSSAKLQRPQ